VHRLVRISPVRQRNARRHTSFSSVWVYPVIDDTINIEINESDLASTPTARPAPGGQHVNKTDSAVRITHIPTGIVVACQQERSQHKNRATAMEMLRAALRAGAAEARGRPTPIERRQKTDIGWGHQIRSYVLQPYQMVKDLRTGVETSDTAAVLDGDLDGFMEASLALSGCDDLLRFLRLVGQAKACWCSSDRCSDVSAVVGKPDDARSGEHL
jgi:peptide chain release factor 2